MKLILTDEQSALSETIERYFREAAEEVFRQEILPAFELEEAEIQPFSDQILIDVTLVTEAEIREINREHRGIDRVTDVLSFPQYEGTAPLFDELEYLDEDQELFLGDVVLCFDRAIEQSHEYGTTPERETVYLFVHSLLHLLGYDHMEEDGKRVMRAHEERVMGELGLVIYPEEMERE